MSDTNILKSTFEDKIVEKCIICGTGTDYFVDDPIEIRKHYIVGCGQLCSRCFSSISSNQFKK